MELSNSSWPLHKTPYRVFALNRLQIESQSDSSAKKKISVQFPFTSLISETKSAPHRDVGRKVWHENLSSRGPYPVWVPPTPA